MSLLFGRIRKNMNLRHHRHISALVFGSLLLTVLLSSATVASGQVTLHPTRGLYAHFTRENVWMQPVFTIDNRGQSERHIKLAIEAQDGQMGTVSYTRTISIPPRCRRTSSLAYRPGTLTAMAPVRSGGLEKTEQIRAIWDAETGKMLDKMPQQIMKLPATTTTFAFLGDGPAEHDTYSYVKNLTAQLGQVQLNRVKIAELPDRWYGLSMVKMFVIGDADLTELRSSQLEAIIDWTLRGGTLVLSGSESLDEILSGRMGDLAGVSAGGLHYTDRLNLTGGGLGSGDVRLVTAMPFCELDPLDADVLCQAGGLPFATHRQAGEGHVFTIAMPVGALAEQQLHNVWKRIRELSGLASAINSSDFFAPGQTALNEIGGKQGPTSALPVSILMGMMVLILVSGVVLRFRRRGELIWMALMPLVVVLSFGLYFYGRTLSDPERLSNIGLVTGFDGRRARVQQMFAYYSGPSDATLNVWPGNSPGVLTNIGGPGAGVGRSREIVSGQAVGAGTRDVRPNSINAFYVDTMANFAGVDSQLTFDSAGLTGRITNLTDYPIDRAILYADGKAYPLGNLSAGGEVEVSLDADDILPAGEFTSSVTPDDRFNALLGAMRGGDSLGKLPKAVAVSPTAPMLIGYIPSSPIDPLDGRQLHRQGESVLVWPLNLSAPQSGTEISIPPGLLTDRFKMLAGSPIHKGGVFIPSNGASTTMITVQPPRSAAQLDDVTVTISLTLSATGYRMIVQGLQLNALGRVIDATDIATSENPDGSFKIEIPNADRFAVNDGRLVFALKVENLTPESRAIEWGVTNLAVSLKGTVR